MILLVVAAAVVFATGFLMTRAGRPYGTAVLTVHKLVDLAAVVFIVLQVVAVVRGPGLAGLDWPLLVIALLVVVATFASGGIVSASDTSAAWLVTAHRLLPWPLLLLLAATVYRLSARA